MLTAPTCSTMPIEAIASNVLAAQLAVVHDADLDAVGDARLLRALPRAARPAARESVMPVTWTP